MARRLRTANTPPPIHILPAHGDDLLMDEGVFGRYCELIHRTSGIHLTEFKRAMVSARLQGRLRTLGIPGDYRTYYTLLTQDKSGEELVNMINLVSTNVTRFFREPSHFDILCTVFARWKKEKRSSAHLWCAAAASGEEPYTIAMLAKEHLPRKFILTIHASDISTAMLKAAQEGVYKFSATKDIPKPLLHRYFQQGTDGSSGWVRVKPVLREYMRFSKINLITPPFPIDNVLDVVFCRNVMIYFDQETRVRVVKRIGRMLAADGILFLGMAENLSPELRDTWRPVAPSAFILRRE